MIKKTPGPGVVTTTNHQIRLVHHFPAIRFPVVHMKQVSCNAVLVSCQPSQEGAERDGSHRASGFLPDERHGSEPTAALVTDQTITYKLATLTFKAKYCRTRLYLHEQLRDHQIARALRSTTAPLFYRPFVSAVFASPAFYYSAPQVWYCLGTSTRSANTFSSFRRCSKSELFAAAYDM